MTISLYGTSCQHLFLFHYSLSLQYRSHILNYAPQVDSQIWLALEQIIGQHIPKTDEGGDVECVVTAQNIPQLEKKS